MSYTLVSLVLVVAWMVSLEYLRHPRPQDHRLRQPRVQAHRRRDDPRIRRARDHRLPVPVPGGSRLPADRAPGRLCSCSAAVGRGGNGSIASGPAGEYLHRAVLMGDREKSEHVAEQMRRDGGSGIEIVGAITEHGTTALELSPGIPVIADYDDVLDAIDAARADTVILTGADTIGPRAHAAAGMGPRGAIDQSDRRAGSHRCRGPADPCPSGSWSAAHPRRVSGVRRPQAGVEAHLRYPASLGAPHHVEQPGHARGCDRREALEPRARSSIRKSESVSAGDRSAC